MLPKKKESGQLCLFFSFADTLSQKHPLYILANQIDWSVFEKTFSPLYSADSLQKKSK
jgi:IS5 family transposase